MAFSLPQVPFKLTPEDMGSTDLVSALTKGIQLGYLPREKQADLQSTLAKNIYQGLVNKWYEKNIQSEMSSRAAQAGLASEEAANARYKRKNGLLEPEIVQILNRAYGGSIPANVVDHATSQQPTLDQLPENRQSVTESVNNLLQNNSPQMNSMTPVKPLEQNIYSQISQPFQQQTQPQQQQMATQNNFIEGTSIPKTGKGPLADAMVLHALGISPVSAQAAELDKIKSQIDLANLKAANFDKMDAIDKRFTLSQAMGLGYTSDEATKRLREGASLKDLAKEKGYDPEDHETWPLPKAAPTMQMLTQQQRANVARAGIDAISPMVTQALAPYAQKIPKSNYSMANIVDAVSGENTDRQAKAIAAAALSIEMAAMRLRAGGANIGVKLVNETIEKAQNKLEIMSSQLTPEVFTKSQKELDHMIRVMNKAENNALYNFSNEADEEDTSQNTDRLGIR